MDIHGSTLSFPIRPDSRGTLATVSDPAEMAEQYLRDLIETLVSEHMMMPEYGMRDHIFEVNGVGFSALLATELQEKAEDYLLKRTLGSIETMRVLDFIEVKLGESDDGVVFTPGFTLDPHKAAISVTYRIAGDSGERNLVFPTFQFRGEA